MASAQRHALPLRAKVPVAAIKTVGPRLFGVSSLVDIAAPALRTGCCGVRRKAPARLASQRAGFAGSVFCPDALSEFENLRLTPEPPHACIDCTATTDFP